MEYVWTTIHVENLEESVQFYEEIIGLSINRRFIPGPGKEIVFLGQGQTQIELIHEADMKIENKERGISLGFKVESLDKTKALVDGKKIVASPIYQMGPTTKCFFIDDPNGVSIQLVELS